MCLNIDDSEARKLLSQYIAHEVQQVDQAAQAQDVIEAQRHLNYLFRFYKLEAASKRSKTTAEQPTEQPEVPIYRVGTLFLKECYDYLTPGEPEHAIYVTGIRDGNLFTLDRMVTFKYEKHSATGVVGDDADTTRALVLIDDFGHRLQGCFHSHPDMGPQSYLPSGIDKSHQGRLEEAGYPTISAVFTRDGYVKFFSHTRPFKIEVYGKGVKQIDETLFKFDPEFIRRPHGH